MSLYKGGETSLYFKKIAEKEEGANKDSQAPKIKQSRAARILSVKNDLVCIKDVANYYDNAQKEKRSGSYKNRSPYGQASLNGFGQLPQADKESQLIKNAFKQLYQSPKNMMA
jgi:hypothetical protein